MDLVVAVGLLQLALKNVTPRVTGDLGFISSLISCYQVATSCKERTHEIVSNEMNIERNISMDWKEIMEKSFKRMDAGVVTCQAGGDVKVSCRCELQTPKCDHVGSTAVVAVVNADEIVVSHHGDSRVVLSRKGLAVPLSVYHKLDRADELERIQAVGGRVIYWDGARVLGVLAMSKFTCIIIY